MMDRVLRLRAHYVQQRDNAIACGDMRGAGVVIAALMDYDAVLLKGSRMKINFGQILTIAALVNAFVADLKAHLGATLGGQRKEVIVKAIIDALPLAETITGKDLLNDNKFIVAVYAVVDLVLKAPDKVAAVPSFKVSDEDGGIVATLE